MKKLKELLESFKTWINSSNRNKHLVLGTAIFLIITLALMTFVPIKYSALTALCSVVGASLAMEYKDRIWGGKFDIIDILCTDIIPIILTVIIWVL